MFRKIMLNRTACFGMCPVYSIEIDNTGKVQWDGVESVEKKGRYSWTIPLYKVIELNNLINEFGYASYVYKPIGNSKTDYPSVITSVLFDNGYFKKLNHYLGDTLSSNSLSEFENKIEAIIGSINYVGHRR